MNFRNEIQSFARDLAKEDKSASDLWSWLPSRLAAKKGHGDYAIEFLPPISDVMSEAAAAIAYLTRGYAIEVRYMECPCGECAQTVIAEEWKRSLEL